MTDEQKTFEIPEKPAQAGAPEKLTEEKAREQGWSPDEIKIAEETGMLEKNGEKPKEGEKPPEPDKEPPKPEEKPPAPTPEPEPIQSKKEDFDLSPDEEEKFTESFGKGKNVHGLYYGMKSQRARAQAAEAERDRVLEDSRRKDDELKTLGERIEKVEAGTKEPSEEDDQPLTRKQLRETMAQMDSDKADADRKKTEETNALKEKISKALTNQTNHARSQYENFDETVKLGQSLLVQDSSTNEFKNEVNIMTLPEHKRKKALLLRRSLLNAAVHADELKSTDWNAADMSYELGQLHPDSSKPQEKAGQSAEKDGASPERTRGGLTPEEVARVEKNSTRRSSSASVSGSGGRRVVSLEDITTDDLLAMDSKSFEAFEKENPTKVKELMRS